MVWRELVPEGSVPESRGEPFASPEFLVDKPEDDVSKMHGSDLAMDVPRGSSTLQPTELFSHLGWI